eukprot:9504353-Lingulodinium_polyedra.AAC.1
MFAGLLPAWQPHVHAVAANWPAVRAPQEGPVARRCQPPPNSDPCIAGGGVLTVPPLGRHCYLNEAVAS